MAVDLSAATNRRLPLLAMAGLFSLFGLLAALHPAWAQNAAAPDTRDMIEALMPTRQRNLVVRVAKPDAPASVAVAAPNPTPTPAPAPAPVVVAAPPSPPPPPPAAPIPAPTPAPTPAAAGPAPSLSLAIQFELNSSRVRPESGAVLGNLVAAMMSPDLKANRFVIEGHTDARGVPAANQKLSQERAEEVRLFLVALGVHPARLKVVGKGSSELANRRDPMSADNRRVRVVTLE